MNLLEAATQLSESAKFKSWFGKSVLHTDGKPHTFYHGTDSDISAFSHAHIGKGTDQHGAGFYFTNKPETASHYANRSNGESANVLPVHLRVTKPIRTNDEKPFTPLQIHKIISSAPNHKESLENFGDISRGNYHKVLRDAVDSYTDIPKYQAIHTLKNDFYGNHHSEFLHAITDHTGHDAVIDQHEDHVIVNVFHPNQIKSAIGNSGQYSKKSDNITETVK